MTFRIWVAVAILVLSASRVVAAPIVVGNFGDHGWNSGDTRPATGGAANASQIASQIVFMGQGQVVNDAAGGVPGASPTGSLNGLGYVRLDGTSGNPGKSTIGYFSPTGIAPTTSLTDASFSLAYRYFSDSNPTARTLGLSLGMVGTDNNVYTFSHLKPGNVDNAWNQESVDANTGLFYLYGPGALGAGGIAQTLAQWQADAAWSAKLFGGNATLFRVDFNIGSSQRNNLTYLDWVQSNLLNGGDIVDFQAVSAAAEVPEPASLAVWGLVSMAGAAYGWRKRKTLVAKS